MTSWLEAVANGKIKVTDDKPFVPGKPNAPHLLTLEDGRKCVMRPKATKPGFKRGLPIDTLLNRDVAFYRLAQALGVGDLVSPVVQGVYNARRANFSPYLRGKTLDKAHPYAFAQKRPETDAVAKAYQAITPKTCEALFVLHWIAGSRDAHAKNYLLLRGPTVKIVSIDNNASFGQTCEAYYHTFHPVFYANRVDLDASTQSVIARMPESLYSDMLGDLLDEVEIRHAYLRGRMLLDFGPETLSYKYLTNNGANVKAAFPDLRDYFEKGGV